MASGDCGDWVYGGWWLVVVGLYLHFLVLRSIQTLENFFLKMFACKIYVEINRANLLHSPPHQKENCYTKIFEIGEKVVFV